ncbi:MAG TPA: GlsB/YeaQ/YmgE family stress response membrane protein [Candidatus Udaeobacter sp.]|nr:GlsB/YeaQ/YmgE family stress response membrane protein [Candidatus Udaeobacter sp.]
MTIGKIVVWLIVGALAGTLAGRLMTFSKRGFGFWFNMLIGMVGALVGGFFFWLFHIDLHLAEIKITFEDFISAFLGSLFCIIVWRLIRRAAKKSRAPIRKARAPWQASAILRASTTCKAISSSQSSIFLPNKQQPAN